MTILRASEHHALSTIQLNGKVLDLGGDKRSEYGSLFKGAFEVTTVNFDAKANPDIVADLEKPLPVDTASYDAVLLINVLEHIYEFKKLLAESARVLKHGGTIVLVVPYMFPYHPSPGDYYRFSRATLERLLTEQGFSDISIRAPGSGVFAARWLFLERLLPSSVQAILSLLMHPLVRALDALATTLARALKKKYDPADYALGFVVTARHD